LEVTFSDLSPNNPSSWEWNFGDGENSFIQNPTHSYTNPGKYSVSLTVDESRGTATDVLRNLVIDTADTLKFDSIKIPTSAVDRKVVLPIYVHNQFLNNSMFFSFQIKMNGGTVGYRTINFDSISVVGCRTEYFEYIDIAPFDHTNSRYGVSLASDISGGSRYLQPGDGAIVNLHFDLDYSVPDGTIFTFDTLTMSGRPLRIGSTFGTYYPEFVGGRIYVKDEICGDLNNDLTINILDVVYLLRYKYKGGPAPDPLEAGDINLDGEIDLSDIIYLINYKYKGGPEPCNP
jgi:PKD repeat protein